MTLALAELKNAPRIVCVGFELGLVERHLPPILVIRDDHHQTRAFDLNRVGIMQFVNSVVEAIDQFEEFDDPENIAPALSAQIVHARRPIESIAVTANPIRVIFACSIEKQTVCLDFATGHALRIAAWIQVAVHNGDLINLSAHEPLARR